jgi:hypothetical protein
MAAIQPLPQNLDAEGKQQRDERIKELRLTPTMVKTIFLLEQKRSLAWSQINQFTREGLMKRHIIQRTPYCEFDFMLSTKGRTVLRDLKSRAGIVSEYGGRWKIKYDW